MDTALSSINGAYETQIQLPSMSNSPPVISLETEKQIYDEPFEIQKDNGPIYHEPPSNVNKIYEELGGEKFHKIKHHEVRCVVPYVKYAYKFQIIFCCTIVKSV